MILVYSQFWELHPLAHWFPNLSYQNHLEGLLKPRPPDHLQSFWFSSKEVGSEILYL